MSSSVQDGHTIDTVKMRLLKLSRQSEMGSDITYQLSQCKLNIDELIQTSYKYVGFYLTVLSIL